MSFEDTFFLIYFSWTVPWLLASWLRLPRYSGYLQFVGYDYAHFWVWLTRGAEIIFQIVAGCALVLIAGFAGIGSFILLPIVKMMPVLVVVPHLLTGLAVAFAPHGRASQPSSKVTVRAVKLLITAFMLELILVLISTSIVVDLNKAVSNPNTSPEAMFAIGLLFWEQLVLVSACTGPLIFILTPYLLLLAHAINLPIDIVLTKVKDHYGTTTP